MAAGWRKRTIFTSANLANDERDELHMEIYRYFRGLRDSLLLSILSFMLSSLSSLSSSCAASDGGVGIGRTKAKSYGTDKIAFANRIDGGAVAVGGGARGGGAGGDGSK